jgi:hypothetical protein
MAAVASKRCENFYPRRTSRGRLGATLVTRWRQEAGGVGSPGTTKGWQRRWRSVPKRSSSGGHIPYSTLTPEVSLASTVCAGQAESLEHEDGFRSDGTRWS